MECSLFSQDILFRVLAFLNEVNYLRVVSQKCKELIESFKEDQKKKKMFVERKDEKNE